MRIIIIGLMLIGLTACQTWKESDERYAPERWNEGALDREKEMHSEAELIQQELDRREARER